MPHVSKYNFVLSFVFCLNLPRMMKYKRADESEWNDEMK